MLQRKHKTSLEIRQNNRLTSHAKKLNIINLKENLNRPTYCSLWNTKYFNVITSLNLVVIFLLILKITGDFKIFHHITLKPATIKL